MAKLTGPQAAEKWGKRLKAATQEIRDGIDRVTEAPGVKAAAKQDKMLAGITEAITSGKWAERVASVTLAEWKAAAKDKGVGRIAAGVDASMARTIQAFADLIAMVDATNAEIEAMPDTTHEDRIARMVAYSNGMHQRAQANRG